MRPAFLALVAFRSLFASDALVARIQARHKELWWIDRELKKQNSRKARLPGKGLTKTFS